MPRAFKSFSCAAGQATAEHDGSKWVIQTYGPDSKKDDTLTDRSPEGPSQNAILRVLEGAGLSAVVTEMQVFVSQSQHDINHPVPLY